MEKYKVKGQLIGSSLGNCASNIFSFFERLLTVFHDSKKLNEFGTSEHKFLFYLLVKPSFSSHFLGSKVSCDTKSIVAVDQCMRPGLQISGHDGGTGASPISSIKHAGGPWELGLTESHQVCSQLKYYELFLEILSGIFKFLFLQTLIQNGLRERVILRVDGGFKSGIDVLMAAAMGADEYGFGSVAMIATGCVMARICHTNNCPVGVASQVVGLTTTYSVQVPMPFLAYIDLLVFFHLLLYISEGRITSSFPWRAW